MTPSEVVVRPATLGDAAGVARVHTVGWQQGYAGLLPEQFLADRRVSAEVWTDRLTSARPGWAVLVAAAGETAVGFAVTGPAEELPGSADASTGQLFSLYVLADYWGTGVGYALHQESLAALRAHGFRSATLWVLTTNVRAIAFYLRQGWLDDDVVAEEAMEGLALPVRRFRHDLGLATG